MSCDRGSACRLTTSMARSATYPIARPATADPNASRRCSIASCRAIRIVPPPSARRVASSFNRARDRTSARLVNIHAPDEQNEQRATPHQIQRGPDVLHHLVLKSIDNGTEPRVDDDFLELWESIEVRGIQRVDLRLRLFDGDSRLQPGDVGGIVAVSRVIRLLFCCERHGCPQGLLVVSRPELRRHHADDRVRAAIEADVATDCGRIATQLSPPESVADDHLELA